MILKKTRDAIISKWENPEYFLYPGSDADNSTNLIDPSSHFIQEDPTSSICVILQTEKLTNSHENNTSLVEK